MISMIGGVALILDGGNAYAHQRGVQNGADAVANAGATVIAQQLGGAVKTDADVAVAVNAIATANQLDSVAGYYTNRAGQLLEQRRRCRPEYRGCGTRRRRRHARRDVWRPRRPAISCSTRPSPG